MTVVQLLNYGQWRCHLDRNWTYQYAFTDKKGLGVQIICNIKRNWKCALFKKSTVALKGI